MGAEPVGSTAAAAKKYSATATPVIGTAEGTIATLVPGQILVIQNLSVEALYVRLGGTASATVFHYVIPACSAAKDGSSPPFYIDNWLGIVSVAKVAAEPSYVATVLSA